MTTAAFIVSILALTLTVWQGWLSRAHNSLSVRPHIISRWHKRRENEGVYISYELLNAGLGPAIIKELRITALMWTRSRKDITPIEEVVTHCLHGQVPFVLKKHGDPSPGYCIRAHEGYLLGEIFLPKVSREDEERAEGFLRTIGLKLHYASFYGESFTFPPNERKG